MIYFFIFMIDASIGEVHNIKQENNMNEQEIIIKPVIPEGYEIDREKSTIDSIVCKRKDPTPKSWREYQSAYKDTHAYRVCEDEAFCSVSRGNTPWYNEFNTKEQAEAFNALGKLIQLRDSWIGNWKPNWTDGTKKYCVFPFKDVVGVDVWLNNPRILSFPNRDMAQEFFSTFRDLVEQAKMFI